MFGKIQFIEKWVDVKKVHIITTWIVNLNNINNSIIYRVENKLSWIEKISGSVSSVSSYTSEWIIRKFVRAKLNNEAVRISIHYIYTNIDAWVLDRNGLIYGGYFLRSLCSVVFVTFWWAFAIFMHRQMRSLKWLNCSSVPNPIRQYRKTRWVSIRFCTEK